MKEVEFTIDEEGNIKIDMDGFKGKECSNLSKKLAKAFGVIKKRTHKTEYYQVVQQEQQEINRHA